MMGSASQPMLVVKYNRALLKKRKLKEVKDLLMETSRKTEVEFKKVSSIELARIKTEIRHKARKEAKFQIALLLACLVVVTLFLYWLLYT